jgi:hypothetical protein
MSSNIDWHSIILFAEEVFSDGRIRPEGRWKSLFVENVWLLWTLEKKPEISTH